MADQKAIDRIIDRHPLNGRYGFDRDDVVKQVITQARLTEAEAVASHSRGAAKMMLRQDTAATLARLAAAALTDPKPEPVEGDVIPNGWVADPSSDEPDRIKRAQPTGDDTVGSGDHKTLIGEGRLLAATMNETDKAVVILLADALEAVVAERNHFQIGTQVLLGQIRDLGIELDEAQKANIESGTR